MLMGLKNDSKNCKQKDTGTHNAEDLIRIGEIGVKIRTIQGHDCESTAIENLR
jgi:hypothetical protein